MRRSDAAACPRLYTPHPSRRRPASRRCGNARWFGRPRADMLGVKAFWPRRKQRRTATEHDSMTYMHRATARDNTHESNLLERERVTRVDSSAFATPIMAKSKRNAPGLVIIPWHQVRCPAMILELWTDHFFTCQRMREGFSSIFSRS